MTWVTLEKYLQVIGIKAVPDTSNMAPRHEKTAKRAVFAPFTIGYPPLRNPDTAGLSFRGHRPLALAYRVEALRERDDFIAKKIADAIRYKSALLL